MTSAAEGDPLRLRELTAELGEVLERHDAIGGAVNAGHRLVRSHTPQTVGEELLARRRLRRPGFRRHG
ncbi:hypothetical protein OHA79_10600 [Streptomyces sp. NBC_00841]|uniref:hypothetical protein n=1 Tax=unclassified Streptomyces TaxID=2593676 RepID=UPI002250183E|nr:MULTISPECIES: hypothetical protein [unclassified Streptomyces]MCX4536527.1 hypothetical protein [Streptomyces sp. NBC_01669]WRZ98242.1 hypothetical protein OHA79_10600 [Streptomyces sp. NBC_00841]